MFTCIEVSNRFNAKNNTSHREYSYYLPTYALAGINKFYLGKKGTDLKVDAFVVKQEDITSVKMVNGIKIVKRFTNDDDKGDYVDEFMGRDISHLTSNPKFLEKLYSHRMSDEQKKKLHDVFKATFEGTKKYHNYTRDMKPDQQAAMRVMIELTANDYMYVNQDTFEVTNEADPRALEFVHFFLKG